MLGVWWAHLVDWDSGKATAKGDWVKLRGFGNFEGRREFLSQA